MVLASRRAGAGLGIGRLEPVARPRQRRLELAGGLEVVELRQQHRQVAPRARASSAAVLEVEHREGLAPVALAAEEPVAQLVVDGGPRQAPCSSSHSFIRAWPRAVGQAVEEAGVDTHAGSPTKASAWTSSPPAHHLDDRQPEGAGELVVALVVGGHGHDGAGAVAGQHVVGDPDRGASRHRVIAWAPVKTPSSLGVGHARPLAARAVRST